MDNYSEIIENYKSHFSNEFEELLIYVENDFNKSFSLYKRMIEQHFNNYIAYREVDTGNIITVGGTLVVPIDKKEFKDNKKFKLRKQTIYHVIVRKCISDELGFHKENQFMLERILEKKVKDIELEDAVKKALMPFSLDIEGIGHFNWKRYGMISIFDGSVKWCDDIVNVELETDGPGTKTANKAASRLKRIYIDQNSLIEKIYEALVNNYTEEDGTITIWEADDSKVTKEQFVKRLSISGIYIFKDERVNFTIEMDEMFTDHAEEVELTPDGTIVVNGLSG